MTEDELDTRLRSGAVLALDTNVMFGFRELGRLDALVRGANRASASKTPIRLVVPALVHAEMLHDLRCHLDARGVPYDATAVTDGLRDKLTEVVDFTAADADGASAQIWRSHRNTDAWRDAKRANAIAHLGIQKLTADIPGKHVPATVDWFIAGHALGRGWLLVTRDRGPEFAGLERVNLDPLKAALTRLAHDP